MSETETKEDSGAAVSKAYYAERRRQEKESWEAYFRLRDEEVKGRLFPTMVHWMKRLVDTPVTYVAENFIFPLHEKYKRPFYHRRISRVPEIDQCKVMDTACIQEANFQYRLDRALDTEILQILNTRAGECMEHYGQMLAGMAGQSMAPCIPLLEEAEEAELNFFIKYGELGIRGDARHALAKQKHRMIWERRHPEVMAERERAYKEHQRLAKAGHYDQTFWSHGGSMPFHNKTNTPFPYEMYNEEDAFADSNMSKDWSYYRDLPKEGSHPQQEEKQRNVWPTRSF